jgi:hypothetical protein
VSFAEVGGGVTDYLTDQGQLWRMDATGGPYQELATAIASLAAGSGQNLWALTTGGQLYEIESDGWHLASSGISTIATGPGQNLWALTTGGQLYEIESDGWYLVSSGGIASIAASLWDTIIVMTTSGAFWRITASGWVPA